MTRSISIIAAQLGVAAALASPAQAAAPVQGLYEACAPSVAGQACGERLSQFGKAGFSLVLNTTVWSADDTQVLSYADAAHQPASRSSGRCRSARSAPRWPRACGS